MSGQWQGPSVHVLAITKKLRNHFSFFANLFIYYLVQSVSFSSSQGIIYMLSEDFNFFQLQMYTITKFLGNG